MDKLLQKLRQNMAELSLQGDDFTRQIWQMYATFEEFIDHQQSPGDGSPPRHPNQDAPPPPPAPSGGIGTHEPSLPRDAGSSPFSRMSPTMSSVSAASVILSTSSSATRRRSSPPVTHDDLALVSPRRSRRRRPRRLRRSVDNPLLDTISTIGGDSDEDQTPLHHHYPHHLQPHSPASCSRLHPETDSIGYAGSNSVDSGYKSACPTPDLPDLMYPEHRLEKRGSLVSLASSGSSGGSIAGSKPRIPMGTRVMARGGGVPKSPGTCGGSTPTRRTVSDSSYYEMDHLVALRQALLGSPTDSETRTIGLSRYSPRVSPATLPLCLGTSQRDIHISRRAASPASPERRPRSASTGSRCSPGTRGTRKAFQAGSPLLASTGSLPRATSPGRRPSLSPAGREEPRPPPAWSRHSSPGMSAPAGRGRRPPSPIVGVEQDRESELALLEREIDALLYGGRGSAAQYYDLESGREFPCPFGGVQDSHSCRPAMASVRRLREGLREVTTSSSVNDDSKSSFSSSTSSSSSAAPSSSQSQLSKTTSSGSLSSTPPGSLSTGAPPLESSSTTSSSNVTSNNAFTFCSSDVAKCVLAMLDGFPQSSKEGGAEESTRASRLLGTGVLKELRASSCKQKYRTTPYPRQDSNSDTCSSDCDGDSSCSSCSEYHLYEEILYETSNKPPTRVPKVPSPPPLPARPPLLLKFELEAQNREFRKSKAAKLTPGTTGFAPEGNFECCGCTCEFPPDSVPPKENMTPPSKEARGKTVVTSNASVSKGPPVPPLRTTSQLTQGGAFLSRQRLPVASTSTAVQPSTGFLPTSEGEKLLKSEISHARPPSLKPVPPPRVLSKPAENVSSISCKENNATKDHSWTTISPANEERTTEKVVSQSSKPKQRNNLYSIFRDRHHRRFLSASLELEYNHQAPPEKDAKLEIAESLKENYDPLLSPLQNPTVKARLTTLQESSSLTYKQSGSFDYEVGNLESHKDFLVSSSDCESSRKPAPSSTHSPKRPTVRSCITAACSLDANSPVDDDYGFQALPRVV